MIVATVAFVGLAVAVHAVVVVVVGLRLREALEGVVDQRQSLPTAEQLHRWGQDLQAGLLRGEQEVHAACVQLQQSTEMLGRRVAQVEHLAGVDQAGRWGGAPRGPGAGR